MPAFELSTALELAMLRSPEVTEAIGARMGKREANFPDPSPF